MSRLPVHKTYKLYVGGAFPRSESGRTYEAEGANVARASRKDLRDAVRAARAAQPKWASMNAYNRGPGLYRGAARMEGRRDEVVTALSKHVVVGEGLVDQDLHIALAQGVQRLLFTVDEAQVLHDSNLLRMAIRSIDRSKGARLDMSCEKIRF